MKIICLEEHTLDAGLDAATRAAQFAEARYLADLGGQAEDTPPAPGADHPQLVFGLRTMARLAADLGAGRIAEMDRHGIDMQVLSYSNTPQLAPPDQAVSLTQAANDRLAAAVRAHPARFAGFAALPWQDPAAAVAELTRAVQELGFKGALLIGRPGATFLDDPRYDPVLAKLSELKVPLYVHPGIPLPQVREPYYGGLGNTVSARLSLFGWGWHNEAGVHAIRMILAGVFDRHPDLQVISGHWGEMVPFYLDRMDESLPQLETGLSRTITQTYREHFYVTPSGMLTLPQFNFTLAVLGADRIMFAVDYPYLTMDGARSFLETLPIDAADKAKIAHGNAEALLRL